ncbi:MAG: N-acetylglucosaminyldiphosphoundecaprenol N-acetyl-beta-D-mannosaminyltransferase, partial [Ilumatobacteraceae bacterium]
MTHGFAPRPPALLFGVAIDDLTMDETVAAVGDLVADGRRHGRTHQIVTANVDFLVTAHADDGVHHVLQTADICLADGAPIVWAARSAHMALRERIAGADLVPALAARSAATGWRIHLFGSAPGTAERAAELLIERFPGARITGDSGPFINDVSQIDEALLATLVAADPDILCVALGNPKQEKFIRTYRQRLGTPVMIGIGGTLDFIVGGRRRAPGWVQRIGLEWVVRAAQEPRRLGRRYAHDGWVFFPGLARYLQLIRRYRADADCLRYEVADTHVLASIAPGTGAVSESTGWQRAVGAVAKAGLVRIDTGSSSRLSMSALCELVGLVRA